MKKRRNLRLVGTPDPTDVFNDLAQLRQDQQAPQPRRRLVETFARIPHDRALELYRRRISADAWAVLIELDRLILKARGRNPVKFSSRQLRAVGIAHFRRLRALRHLERAGVIKVERLGPGRAPWVTHLWFPTGA